MLIFEFVRRIQPLRFDRRQGFTRYHSFEELAIHTYRRTIHTSGSNDADAPQRFRRAGAGLWLQQLVERLRMLHGAHVMREISADLQRFDDDFAAEPPSGHRFERPGPMSPSSSTSCSTPCSDFTPRGASGTRAGTPWTSWRGGDLLAVRFHGKTDAVLVQIL